MVTPFQKQIRHLLRGADRATTSQAKGRAFEDLVCYLFQQIPGVVDPQRNKMNAFGSEEVDVAFWNEQDRAGLWAFDPVLLVECKNWTTPVSSIDVSWFVSKVEGRSLNFGVLIAANGITGSDVERTAAHAVIAQALARKTRIIVITCPEIESLDSGASLVLLIQRKVVQLVVTGTVGTG